MQQVANIFTKPLASRENFERLISKLGLIDVHAPTWRGVLRNKIKGNQQEVNYSRYLLISSNYFYQTCTVLTFCIFCIFFPFFVLFFVCMYTLLCNAFVQYVKYEKLFSILYFVNMKGHGGIPSWQNMHLESWLHRISKVSISVSKS